MFFSYSTTFFKAILSSFRSVSPWLGATLFCSNLLHFHFTKNKLTHDMAKSLIERIEITDRSNVAIIFKFRDEFSAIQKYAKGVAA